jgi:ParB/RepB/Spo0J family partition protein
MAKAATATAPASTHTSRTRDTEVESLTGDPVSSESGRDLSKVMKTAQKMLVSLDNVFINKAENIREYKSYTEDDIQEMAYQIEAVGGITNPIQIAKVKPSEKTENKPYILVTGFRRSLALLSLAEIDPVWKENVPAVLLNDANTRGATRIVQLIENMGRKQLNAMEIAIAANDALQDKESDFTQKDIARLLGRSEGNISQLLQLNRLPEQVQQMISSGKLPWTHARELVRNKNVPESAYLDLATKGCDMLLDDFQDLLDDKWGEDATGDGTTAQGGAGTGSSQKPAKMLRATEVESIYLQFLEDRVKAADTANKTFTAKDVENARLDAIKTVLKNQETDLEKAITPYKEERKKAEEAEDKAKDAKKAEDKFFREKAKRAEEIYKAPADPSKDTPRPQWSACYAQVAKEIMAMKDEDKAKLGFDFAPYKDAKMLVNKIATTLQEIIDNRAKLKAEREKREAEDKAKADAAAATAGNGGTAAPAATPAAATK